MTARCPKCSGAIAEGDLNVSANIARCAACNEVFPLSELVTDKTSEERASVLAPPVVDLNTPPAGVRYEQTFDGVIVSATTRSCFVIPMIPFICLWSGGSLSGIYGSQIMKGQFNPAMSLFGLPFLAGTVFLVGYVLMGIFGRVEIRLRGDDGEVFTGVGPIGRTKHFQLSEVTGVHMEVTKRSKGGITKQIVIDGPTPIKFGSMLNYARQEFLLAVLKKLTAKQ